MQIEQKLQTGVVALLLSLIAIAGPANSQTAQDCVPASPFPPAAPSAACQAFLASLGDGVQDCPAGTTGDGLPDCTPDSDPTAGLPCADADEECPADGAGEGLPCLIADTFPPACDPDFETPDTGYPCLVPAAAGPPARPALPPGCDPDAALPSVQEMVDDAICGALDAEFESTADDDFTDCVDAASSDAIAGVSGIACEAFATATDSDVEDCLAALAEPDVPYFLTTLLVSAGIPAECLAGPTSQACQDALPEPIPTILASLNEALFGCEGAVAPSEADDCAAPTFSFGTPVVGTESSNTRLVTGQVTADEDVTGAVLSIVSGAPPCVGGDADIIWTGDDDTKNLVANAATNFVATLVCPAGSDYDYTIIVSGETSTKNLAIDNVAFTPFGITVGIDSVASQDTQNRVFLTGTALATDAAPDASISLAPADGSDPACAASAPAPEFVVNNILWASNNDVIQDLEAGSSGFNFYVCSDNVEVVTYEVSIDVGSLGVFVGEVTVDFSQAGSEITVSVQDVAAELVAGALAPASYLPDGILTQVIRSDIVITDHNGASANGDGTAENGRVNDDRLTTVLATTSDSRTMTKDTAATASGIRTISVKTTLPQNLKDTVYTLTATYNNYVEGQTDATSNVRQLTVTNSDPVIAVTPITALGTTRIAGSSLAIPITLKDANIGSLSGAGVTELKAFGVSIKGSSDCVTNLAGSGISFAFSALPTGINAGSTGINYVGKALNDGQTTLSLKVNWAASTAGNVYYICGTVTDDQDRAYTTRIATLELSAINGGFHLTIDDGGDGLDVATPIAPNAVATTDALRVLLSGTYGATSLAFSVGQFTTSTIGSDPFTAEDLTGKLCVLVTAAGTDCAPDQTLIGATDAVTGTVTFDLTALGADVFDLDGDTNVAEVLTALPAGTPVFAVFSFRVPDFTGAGEYSSSVTVSGTPETPPAA